MHCHLIVSRKDQANKKKLSPLTNHKNTTKGVIKGGFDRKNLFQQAEQGFDKLFGYDRQLTESFEYYNTMKNGSISEQLKMQERQIAGEREKKHNINPTNLGLSSALVLLTPDAQNKEKPTRVKRKKKKQKNGFRK